MDNFIREYWVNRINSGYTKISLQENKSLKTFFFRPLTKLEKYISMDVYLESYQEALENGALTENQVLEELIGQGMWSKENQKLLEKTEEDIEKLKVKLCERFDNKIELRKGKEMLLAVKKKNAELQQMKSQMDDLSAAHIASLAKSRYIIGKSLVREDLETNVFDTSDFWKMEDSEFLNQAIMEFYKKKPFEATIRELARTEPWRSIWACRHSEGVVFGKPASDLTDEQRYLLIWTRIYDNTAEDENPPSDELMEDDDAFDGWLIIRKGRIAKSREKGVAEFTRNGKIINADEQFVVVSELDEYREAKNEEEKLAVIQRVVNFNSGRGKNILKSRADAINEKGRVLEHMLPDRNMEIKMKLNQMSFNKG